jgi:transposase
LLHQEGCLPIGKLSDIFHSIFGQSINEGTIFQIQQMAYEKLETTEKWIANQLRNSEKVHVDESGIRVEGKLYWIHTLGNEQYTLQYVHAQRGYDAHVGTVSFLKDFEGWLIHDFWSSYLKFKDCKHAFCMAHILRELEALIENGGKWAITFKKFFRDLYEKTDDGKGKLSKEEWQKTAHQFDKLLRQADKEEPKVIASKKRGRTKQTKGRNLLQRLKDNSKGVLAFAKHKIVPFTNNLAERDIRPAKSKIKIAGSFRASSGANAYARIRSFISTVKKHHSNPFNELVRVFQGNDPLFYSKYC